MISKALKFILLCAAALLFLVSIGVGFIYLQNLWSPPSITSLESGAAQGDAEAQYQLALRYKNGTGTPQNLPKAIELLSKAAEQNHVEALNSMGIAFREGKGVIKDFGKAISYFERASKLNFHAGTYNLAFMHENGLGTKQDYDKAFSLYQQAEVLGSTTAKARLGRMYMMGLGREVDLVKAYSYFLRAADEGNAYAQFYVGLYYEDGKGTISSDIKKAIEWYEKSAAQNFPESLSKLGYLYSEGKGVEQDYLKAGEYFYRAASFDNANSIEILDQAKKACIKNNVENNINYDLPWCFLAATTHDPASMHATGLAYNAGKMNLKQDYEKAYSWFLPCAEQGYPSCQIHLAMMCDKGDGIQEDDIAAYAWFSVALKSKNLNEEQKTVSTTVRKIIFEEFNEQQKLEAEDKAKLYERDFFKEE